MKTEKNRPYQQVATDLANRLRSLLQRRDEIDREIDDIREAFKRLEKVGNIEIPDYVLPDAPAGVSEVCEATLKYAEKPMTTADVRDYLIKCGFLPRKDYKNPLATIHTTLKRMEKKGQIVLREQDGKIGYVWNDARFMR